MPLKTSDEAKDLIKHYEGLRTIAYKDPAGNYTIGYGHLMHPNEGMIPVSLSPDGAEDLLKQDLEKAEKHVKDLVRVPLSQGQFDALVSFTFNVGETNLRNSTLLKKVNQADFEGAAEEFDRWIHAGGKVLQGLVKRRSAEKGLFTL